MRMVALTTISSPPELNRFRGTWSGSAVLGLLSRCRGRLLISWPIGVGKSFNIDQVIAEAVNGGRYDLVIALFPTKSVVEERAMIRNPDPNIKLVHLRARPQKSCGHLNKDWLGLERRSLSLWGKAEICSRNPCSSSCFWPGQFSQENLEGAQVVIATHAQLRINPYFFSSVAKKAGAAKVLVIIDEGSFTTVRFRQTIKKAEIDRLVVAVEGAEGDECERNRWLDFLDWLLNADTIGLREGGWDLPAMSSKMVLAVQKKGLELFGDEFVFPAFALSSFEKSPPESREKLSNGGLSFALVPEVQADFIVYSGTTRKDVIQYRLGNDFVDYFKDCQFCHPDTRIYNISSKIGMKKYFPRNATQILDFFARLVALRVAAGKRVLLVSKKCFLDDCIKGLQERFDEMGVAKRVVNAAVNRAGHADPDVIPVINYGVIGTNDFQDFDCAFCLNGYFVNEKIVSDLLQDTLAEDIRVPVEITYSESKPCRRSARAKNRRDWIYDVHHLAPAILYQLEVETVLQAVGRIRPYTSPAEIIMFLLSDHPDGFTGEFGSLEEARRFFGVESARRSRLAATIEAVQRAKERGLKQREAVIETGYSITTIQRYWNIDKE